MNGGYRVIWLHRLIEHDVAGFVVAAMQSGASAAPITAAMNEIDRLLSASPHSHGESRGPGERILFVPPLAARYEVHDDEQVVVIQHVTYRPPRGENG
jgi:hypothetical protein